MSIFTSIAVPPLQIDRSSPDGGRGPDFRVESPDLSVGLATVSTRVLSPPPSLNHHEKGDEIEYPNGLNKSPRRPVEIFYEETPGAAASKTYSAYFNAFHEQWRAGQNPFGNLPQKMREELDKQYSFELPVITEQDTRDFEALFALFMEKTKTTTS